MNVAAKQSSTIFLGNHKNFVFECEYKSTFRVRLVRFQYSHVPFNRGYAVGEPYICSRCASGVGVGVCSMKLDLKFLMAKSPNTPFLI